jgi:hypothetical protein
VELKQFRVDTDITPSMIRAHLLLLAAAKQSNISLLLAVGAGAAQNLLEKFPAHTEAGAVVEVGKQDLFLLPPIPTRLPLVPAA